MKLLALASGLLILASCGGGAIRKGDIETISKGTAFSKADYLVPGKVSILEFTTPG